MLYSDTELANTAHRIHSETCYSICRIMKEDLTATGSFTGCPVKLRAYRIGCWGSDTVVKKKKSLILPILTETQNLKYYKNCINYLSCDLTL